MSGNLTRYSRQMILPEVGTQGQNMLSDSRVLVFGAGGLGSPALLYLAGAGVGTLTIVDPDTVDLSNLQRQIVHRQADIGRNKAESARDNLLAMNPDITVHTIQHKLAGDELASAASRADIVLDCTDNFPARFAINDACRDARVPLVLGAAIRTGGQLIVFRFDKTAQPDYRSLFAEGGESAERCEDAGVLGPVVGSIGTLQALEALKLLLGVADTASGRLQAFDGLNLSLRGLGAAG